MYLQINVDRYAPFLNTVQTFGHDMPCQPTCVLGVVEDECVRYVTQRPLQRGCCNLEDGCQRLTNTQEGPKEVGMVLFLGSRAMYP